MCTKAPKIYIDNPIRQDIGQQFRKYTCLAVSEARGIALLEQVVNQVFCGSAVHL
jgi:hypothetical protein